jgi:hypothetical protein
MGHWGRENGPYQISFPIGIISDATYFEFYRPGRQGRVIARAAPLSVWTMSAAISKSFLVMLDSPFFVVVLAMLLNYEQRVHVCKSQLLSVALDPSSVIDQGNWTFFNPR